MHNSLETHKHFFSPKLLRNTATSSLCFILQCSLLTKDTTFVGVQRLMETCLCSRVMWRARQEFSNAVPVEKHISWCSTSGVRRKEGMFVKALLVGFLFWQMFVCMCMLCMHACVCVFIGGAWALPSIRMCPQKTPTPPPPTLTPQPGTLWCINYT